jgi:hypothetical protein
MRINKFLLPLYALLHASALPSKRSFFELSGGSDGNDALEQAAQNVIDNSVVGGTSLEMESYPYSESSTSPAVEPTTAAIVDMFVAHPRVSFENEEIDRSLFTLGDQVAMAGERMRRVDSNNNGFMTIYDPSVFETNNADTVDQKEIVLPVILSDLHLTIGQKNAILNIYLSESKLSPFRIACRNLIDVIVNFRLGQYDDLNSAEEAFATALHGLGTVIAQKGEIPNCGYVPNDKFSAIAMFNYAPLDEKDHETDSDKETFNLTHPNSSCLRVWAKTVPELLGSCDSDYLDSFHFIDLRCWAFTIDLNAKNRNELTKQEVERFSTKFGVSGEEVTIPFAMLMYGDHMHVYFMMMANIRLLNVQSVL